MTQTKTFVDQLPGQIAHLFFFYNKSCFQILEPPSDLNDYFTTRQSSTVTQREMTSVSLPPPIDESDQGGSSMITT